MGDILVTTGDPIQRRQAIAANPQRRFEIKRDMQKMADLTQELKESLEKAVKPPSHAGSSISP